MLAETWGMEIVSASQSHREGMKPSVQSGQKSLKCLSLGRYPLRMEFYICACKKTSDSPQIPRKWAFKALLVRLCRVALSEHILQIVATHTQIVVLTVIRWYCGLISKL